MNPMTSLQGKEPMRDSASALSQQFLVIYIVVLLLELLDLAKVVVFPSLFLHLIQRVQNHKLPLLVLICI